MTLAKGGAPWVAAAAVLAVATVLAVHFVPAVPTWLLVLVLPLAFFIHFFRDPDRAVGPGIVSPADGRVLEVADAPDGGGGGGHGDGGGDGGPGTVVRIFMGPFDVHVNRAPCDATVTARTHRPGAHRPAFDKDADANERMEWTLDTDHGEVRVVQIAGAFARRIVPYVAVGETVRKGDRLGLIRLGSRVDLHLPAGVAPVVAPGDRVTAGTSPVGRPEGVPLKEAAAAGSGRPPEEGPAPGEGPAPAEGPAPGEDPAPAERPAPTPAGEGE